MCVIIVGVNKIDRQSVGDLICSVTCGDKSTCGYDDGCGGTCNCELGVSCVDGVCVDLKYKFRPIIKFNSAEKFFPTSIESMLSVSSLTLGTSSTVLVSAGGITTENIATFNNIYDAGSNPPGYNLRITVPEAYHRGDASFENAVATQQLNVTNSVPIYVHQYDLDAATMVIQYIILYNYNGSQKLPIIGDVGMHKGDVEHVSVYVDKNTQKITNIYFAAHATGSGMFVAASGVQFEGDRPIVYAARSSHASYPAKNRYPVQDAFGLYEDVTDDTGVHWYTENIIVIDENTPWNQFKGNLGGSGGPRSPMSQGWWNTGL